MTICHPDFAATRGDQFVSLGLASLAATFRARMKMLEKDARACDPPRQVRGGDAQRGVVHATGGVTRIANWRGRSGITHARPRRC